MTGFQGKTAVILGKTLRVAAVLAPTGTSLDYSILMPIDSARSLARSSPYLQLFWGKWGDPQGLISAILVDVDNHTQKSDVALAIDDLGGLSVIQASDVLQRIKDQMNILFLIMLGGGLLAAVASIFQFIARFFSLAWDRKGEWGLYRALGATRRDLKLLIAGEALVSDTGWHDGRVSPGLCPFWPDLCLSSETAGLSVYSAVPASHAAGNPGHHRLFPTARLDGRLVPRRQSGKIEPSSAMALGDID